MSPELAAEEILYFLLSWEEEEFPEDAKGPFLWEGVIRLKIKKTSAVVEMPVAISPFEGRDQLSQWVGIFLATISNRKAAFGNVKFQVLDEGIIREEDHFFGDDDFEVEEYVLNPELDPEKEGREFFSFLMQDLLESRNQFT